MIELTHPPFGPAIKREREARRFSQRRLARAAGISKSALRGYEAGESEPGVAAAERIAWALDMTLPHML